METCNYQELVATTIIIRYNHLLVIHANRASVLHYRNNKMKRKLPGKTLWVILDQSVLMHTT